jgi:hypothetical protein
LCPTVTREVILARGHDNILASHETTLEITKETELSERGNCIIAVAADKAIDDLSREFKANLRNDRARLTILLRAGELTETINASGSSQLVLVHPTSMVVRKSGYICDRTLAIQAEKSAIELSREFVRRLRNSKQEIKIALTVKA